MLPKLIPRVIPEVEIPSLKIDITKQEKEEFRDGKLFKIFEKEFAIPCDNIFAFTPDTECALANQKTINDIVETIAEEHLDKNKTMLDILSLHINTQWVWKTNLGTLPKRISKWYHNTTSEDLSENTLSKIGNNFRKSIPKQLQYYVDFTKKFNWSSGDFGDSGSCFWSSNSGARYAMEKEKGFYSMRFFRQKCSAEKPLGRAFQVNHFYPRIYETTAYFDKYYFYPGYARAWIYIGKEEKIVHKNIMATYPYVIIFNGYGIQTNTIASLFSQALNLPVKRIDIQNRGQYAGYLYVNDYGWLIGDSTILENKNHHDFNLKF